MTKKKLQTLHDLDFVDSIVQMEPNQDEDRVRSKKNYSFHSLTMFSG